MDSSECVSYLTVHPDIRDKGMFYVRLRTRHYSFSIKSSCVTRSVNSFYQLRSILSKHHPYLSLPKLPLYPCTWVYNCPTLSDCLATFVAGLLAEKQLLSCKALHLFLQSELSMDRIKDNMEGRRDDEVVVDKNKIVRDDRNNARDGFGSLFGSPD